jgi:hypothetical protein
MKVDSIGPKCQVISHVRALGQLLIDIPMQICYKLIDITWEQPTEKARGTESPYRYPLPGKSAAGAERQANFASADHLGAGAS